MEHPKSAGKEFTLVLHSRIKHSTMAHHLLSTLQADYMLIPQTPRQKTLMKSAYRQRVDHLWSA